MVQLTENKRDGWIVAYKRNTHGTVRVLRGAGIGLLLADGCFLSEGIQEEDRYRPIADIGSTQLNATKRPLPGSLSLVTAVFQLRKTTRCSLNAEVAGRLVHFFETRWFDGSDIGAQVEDREIYELASDLLGTLTRELGAGIYAKLEGELTIQWSSVPIFGAYASSRGPVDQPPQHCVTIHYEFVRQMWRDAENFCHFLTAIPGGSETDRLYDDREKLPSCFSEEEQIKNLFIAALTWVYFHEIGHLMQEHGHIRATYGSINVQKPSEVHEFSASGIKLLTGQAAVVSHTTELAADFEATNFYLIELVRHITDPNFVSIEEREEVFSGLVYLMMCGLSIVFLRFNGEFPPVRSSTPQGSHPDPLTRLEINIPHIFEILSDPRVQEFIGHGLDRKQLVLLSGKANLSAALYWSMTKTKKFDERFLVKGLLSDSAVLQYLAPIVRCWDELLPAVLEIRRFGNSLGLLNFTDQFRERITKIIPWGEGAERNRSQFHMLD